MKYIGQSFYESILPLKKTPEEKIEFLIQEVKRLEDIIRRKDEAARSWARMWKDAAKKAGDLIECQTN